jgi:hypothetical protein
MTVSVVFAIAGVIAILFGIVGGGIKAKEIEIPSLPTKVRIVTTTMGVILISITLWLESNNNAQISPTPTTTLTTLSVTTTSTETLQVASGIPTAQTILFQEDFGSNDLGWKEGEFSDRYAEMKNEFVDGRLRRTVIGNGDFIERTWVPNLTLQDFQISVDVIVVDAPQDAFVCFDSGLIEPGNIGLGVGISDEHEVAEKVIVEFDNLLILETP